MLNKYLIQTEEEILAELHQHLIEVEQLIEDEYESEGDAGYIEDLINQRHKIKTEIQELVYSE